jgi:hypothetical protein
MRKVEPVGGVVAAFEVPDCFRIERRTALRVRCGVSFRDLGSYAVLFDTKRTDTPSGLIWNRAEN